MISRCKLGMFYMGYLILIDNEEVEFPDQEAVVNGFRRGEFSLECWIKVEDVESDWETVEEKFPFLARE